MVLCEQVDAVAINDCQQLFAVQLTIQITLIDYVRMCDHNTNMH